MELFLIFFSAAIVNNFVLSYFLGICPFIGVSNKISSAFSMGLATTFVMTITSIVTWLIYHLILVEFHLEFLEYVSFILVIASLVQFVEMFIKKSKSAPLPCAGNFSSFDNNKLRNTWISFIYSFERIHFY